MQQLKTGEIIRELRKSKNITQEKLAEILGISSAAVSKWESGSTYPDIQTLPILARYFHVSIDFLMGFSNTISQEEREQICQEVTDLIKVSSYDKALALWDYYVRQYINDLKLKYDLANLLSTNLLVMVKDPKLLNELLHKLIRVYEQCLESDDLEIKQGAYFQIGNLYIALQDYDSAYKALSQIPTQKVNPRLLLNMISVSKGDYLTAKTNIQTDILKAINEILMELSHLVTVNQSAQNWDEVVRLFRLQLDLLKVFELTPFIGIGTVLQLANALCNMGKINDAANELDHFLNNVTENKDYGKISDIPLFADTDASKTDVVPCGISAACMMLFTDISAKLIDAGQTGTVQRFREYFGIE
ncbi:MAG: helix-turn-helix domain-containing protein [Roseburia sp.]